MKVESIKNIELFKEDTFPCLREGIDTGNIYLFTSFDHGVLVCYSGKKQSIHGPDDIGKTTDANYISGTKPFHGTVTLTEE